MLAKAVLYPRCVVKKRIGLFLAPFFEELTILIPSESEIEKVSYYSKDLPIDIKPLVTSPLGDDVKRFDSSIKALESWGEQMGLGDSVNFETFYTALSNTTDQEVKEVMSAIKGKEEEEVKMAARIFLALSLEADLREDELEEEMELIEKKTKKLTQLVNEEEEILLERQPISRFIEPINRARERLTAWARFAFENGSLRGVWPVGESVAVKDLVDATFEGIVKRAADSQVFEILLPSKEFIKENTYLLEKTRPIFKQILSRLDKHLYKEDFSEIISLKNELQDYLLPNSNKKESEAKLVLSYYNGVSFQTLINKACKLSEIKKDILPINYSFYIL